MNSNDLISWHKKPNINLESDFLSADAIKINAYQNESATIMNYYLWQQHSSNLITLLSKLRTLSCYHIMDFIFKRAIVLHKYYLSNISFSIIKNIFTDIISLYIFHIGTIFHCMRQCNAEFNASYQNILFLSSFYFHSLCKISID